MEKKVEINESLCTGCGACVSMCPARILKMEKGKAKVTDHESCDMLAGCMYACPTGAIKVNRKARMAGIFGF
jgi:NAD-dependent dihydropyrimidine dehydrogenase PreA subunit